MSAAPPAAPPTRPNGRPVRLDSLKNPQPRQITLSKKQSPAQRMAANNDCPNPDCHDKDVEEEDGQSVCRGCGTVVNDSNMVSEVVFGASGNGATLLHGAHVAADQTFARSTGARVNGTGAGDSREITEATGRRYVNQLGAALTISQSLIDSGMQIFKLAAANNFIQGRRTKSVAAVCLYIACRIQKDTNRIMLIDFSDILMLNVFKLGHIYKDLIDELRINGNGFTVHPINPEDLILRFAYRLEFGEDAMRVANDAVRIVQRMNRDWMTPGRRPAGICGAALILAARMNNFRRTIREMVFIVKVTETTIQKRLEEFKVTESSGLTVEEFRTIDLERFCDPPAFYEKKESKRKSRKRKLIEIDDDDSSGTESRRAESSVANVAKQKEPAVVSQRSQTNSRSMPPPPVPIDPTLIEVSAHRLSELQASSSNDSSTARETTENSAKRRRGRSRRTPSPSSTALDPTPESDLTSLLSAPSTFASANAFSRALSSPTTENPDPPTVPPSSAKPRRSIPLDPDISDSEFASDPEVANCLLTPAEQAIKERIWTHENADYLRAQQTKLLKQQLDEANGTTRTVVKRIRRRGRMGDMTAYRDGDDGDDGGPVASTPAEAAMKMLKKRGYSKKINYETLKALYEPSAPSTASTTTTPNSNTPNSLAKTPTPDPARARTSSSPSISPSPPLTTKSASPIPSPAPTHPTTSTAPPRPAPPVTTIPNSAAPAPAAAAAAASVLPTDMDTDDEHEEGDPDFWREGELERVQEAIEDGLDQDDDDDDDDDDDADVEDEIFDDGSGEEFG